MTTYRGDVMRRALSIMLMALILGLSFSAAVSQSFVLAETQEDEVYEDFWNILNKEAELIVKLNSTINANKTQSLALQLIQNSRNGSSNAAQISALIWQSLEELKNSGVKTYYTAEELRQMAQNISENGLPDETVQLLKQQGWSDEEIQALQEYIAQNAENITEDFNLTAFLENFSTAFVQVAFKYNHYEAWAIEKWKWRNPVNGSTPQGEEMINPLLTDEWINFYKAYYNRTLEEQLTSLNKLQSKVYSLITGSLAGKKESLILPPKPIHQPVGESTTSILLPIRIPQVKNIKHLTGNALEFETWELVKVDSKECTSEYNVTKYYWKSPLEAYQLIREIHSLLLAKQFGNKDIELNWQLNEKISELKEALVVTKGESVIKRIKNKCEPIILPPQPPRDPKMNPNTKNPGDTEQTNQHQMMQIDELALRALDVGDETKLHVSGEIIVHSVTPSEVKYKVKVTVKAENAQATNIIIYIDGKKEYGSFDLGAGESKTVTLPVGKYFREDAPTNAQEVTLSKTIKVTYTKWCSGINSAPGREEVLSTPAGCGGTAEVVKTVTKTIELFDVKVSVSDTTVKVNEPVELTFTITNYMTSDKTFNLLVTAGGESEEGTLTVPAGETKTKTLQLTFSTPGERTYYAKVDGTTYAVGTIKVEDDDSSPPIGSTLKITGFYYSPEGPVEGDNVTFGVRVYNSISSGITAMLKLMVRDKNSGEVVYSEEKSISPDYLDDSEYTFTWSNVKAGDYTAEAKVLYNGEVKDSETRDLTIGEKVFEGSLFATPSELESNGTVLFDVFVKKVSEGIESTLVEVVDKDGVPVYTFITKLSKDDVFHEQFTLDLHASGNYTFTLKVNGRPLDSAKVSVIDNVPKDIVAEMECHGDTYSSTIRLGSYVSCIIHIEGKNIQEYQEVKLEEVIFGTKVIWGSYGQINAPTLTVDPQPPVVGITPADTKEDIEIKFTLNDEFAMYYFDSSWDFSYKLAGHSYYIQARLTPSITVADLIEIIETTDSGSIDSKIEKAKKAKEFLDTVKSTIEAPKNAIWIAIEKLVKIGKEIWWLWKYSRDFVETDKNNVIGG